MICRFYGKGTEGKHQRIGAGRRSDAMLHSQVVGDFPLELLNFRPEYPFLMVKTTADGRVNIRFHVFVFGLEIKHGDGGHNYLWAKGKWRRAKGFGSGGD